MSDEMCELRKNDFKFMFKISPKGVIALAKGNALGLQNVSQTDASQTNLIYIVTLRRNENRTYNNIRTKGLQRISHTN